MVCYAKGIYEHLENQQDIEINMKLSIIKPLVHTVWIIEAINYIANDKHLVKQCWEDVGIEQFLPNSKLMSTLCLILILKFSLGVCLEIRLSQIWNSMIFLSHQTVSKETWRGSSLSGIGKQMDDSRLLLLQVVYMTFMLSNGILLLQVLVALLNSCVLLPLPLQLQL